MPTRRPARPPAPRSAAAGPANGAAAQSGISRRNRRSGRRPSSRKAWPASLLGKAPLTPANELPDLDPTTPQATLSSTARVLTSVLSTAQNGLAAPLALIGKSALFGNAAPSTEQLAQKLHDTISQSGLFYESHVTEWVKGERTLPDLMREPQMQRMLQSGETAARAGASGPDLTSPS